MEKKQRIKGNHFAGGEWQDRSAKEPFVQCPKLFTENLSPEEYRAQQQIYQVAFEKAREVIRERLSDSDRYSAGEGI